MILEAGPPSREELGRSLGGAREELGRSLGEPGRGPGCGRGRPEEVWREGGRGGARRPSGEVRPGSPAPVSDLTGGWGGGLCASRIFEAIFLHDFIKINVLKV